MLIKVELLLPAPHAKREAAATPAGKWVVGLPVAEDGQEKAPEEGGSELDSTG